MTIKLAFSPSLIHLLPRGHLNTLPGSCKLNNINITLGTLQIFGELFFYIFIACTCFCRDITCFFSIQYSPLYIKIIDYQFKININFLKLNLRVYIGPPGQILLAIFYSNIWQALIQFYCKSFVHARVQTCLYIMN